MNKLLFSLALILYCHCADAQVRRNYSYKGSPVALLAQNNRMENNFSFPGMRIFIIIGAAQKPLDSIYAMDRLRRMAVTGMNDYACFYYLSYQPFLKDDSIARFLKDFIAYSYNEDFTDRNSVHLVWENKKDTIPCKVLNELTAIISSVNILNGNPVLSCDTLVHQALTPEDIWQRSRTAKTSVAYTIPSLQEMEEVVYERQRKYTIAAYSKKKSTVFLQFTLGSHFIGNPYKTDFDTNTLVDFTAFKTLWNIHAGYYVTHRLFTSMDFAFIYSGKRKNIDDVDWGNGNGVTVSGSGYAGAMLRYGAGLGWVVYSKKRLDIRLNFEAGKLHALAGGGNATRTLGSGGSKSTNIVKEKEQNTYCNLRTSIDYMIGNGLYFTSNVQYTIAPFKQAIGSVTAFTGWSYNLGFGLTLSTKNKAKTE